MSVKIWNCSFRTPHPPIDMEIENEVQSMWESSAKIGPSMQPEIDASLPKFIGFLDVKDPCDFQYPSSLSAISQNDEIGSHPNEVQSRWKWSASQVPIWCFETTHRSENSIQYWWATVLPTFKFLPFRSAIGQNDEINTHPNEVQSKWDSSTVQAPIGGLRIAHRWRN
jgi:hypothetical protein